MNGVTLFFHPLRHFVPPLPKGEANNAPMLRHAFVGRGFTPAARERCYFRLPCVKGAVEPKARLRDCFSDVTLLLQRRERVGFPKTSKASFWGSEQTPALQAEY